MNKFFRVILGTAGVCLVLGVIIIIFVSATGGWNIVRNGINNNDWNWNFNWGSSHRTNYKYEDIKMDFNQEDIKSLDVTIPYGDVVIKQGEGFSLSASQAVEGSFEDTKVEDGVLKIEQKYDDDFWDTIGIHVGETKHSNYPKIEITVPKDFVAKEFNLDFSAGKIDISDLNTEYTSLELGAGDFQVNRLTADEIDIDGGIGKIEMGDVTFNDMNMDTGVGAVKIQGKVTGDCKISAGVGQVDFDIDGDKEDYYIDLDSGIGEVRYNNEKINSSTGERSAKNLLDIDAGVGQIKINIE